MSDDYNAPLTSVPTAKRIEDRNMLARGFRRFADIPEDGTWAVIWPGFYGQPFTGCAISGEWMCCEEIDRECAAWWVPDPFAGLDHFTNGAPHEL